jgi:hypothetical protein
MGEDDFRKGGGDSTERIEYPIQDKEGALVDRLQSRFDNWSETVSRRIVQNVTDKIETEVSQAADARLSYCVLAIEIPSKNVNSSIWSNIKKRLGSWLKENGLEYYFPKGEIWEDLEMSLFDKSGELGKKGWGKKKFFKDTGSHESDGYNYSQTINLGRHSTVQIEDEWRGLMLETNHRLGGETDEYPLLLHWKIDYP